MYRISGNLSRLCFYKSETGGVLHWRVELFFDFQVEHLLIGDRISLVKEDTKPAMQVNFFIIMADYSSGSNPFLVILSSRASAESFEIVVVTP